MVVSSLVPTAKPETVEGPGHHADAHHIRVVEFGILAEPSSDKTPHRLDRRISTPAGLLRWHPA